MNEYVWCSQCNRSHPADYHLSDCDSELSAAKKIIVELEAENRRLRARLDGLLEAVESVQESFTRFINRTQAVIRVRCIGCRGYFFTTNIDDISRRHHLLGNVGVCPMCRIDPLTVNTQGGDKS